jgi:hypothetical protein
MPSRTRAGAAPLKQQSMTQVSADREGRRADGRTPRTIERWLDDEKLNFPQPVYINRFKYWNLDELETWERKQAATSVRSSEGHPAPKKCITPAGRAAT